MKKILVLSIILVMLGACAPSAEAIQTAIAETESVKPTNTVVPTGTATPTRTLTPTLTVTPTQVPPEILTLEAGYLTQTEIVENITATQMSIELNVTKTAMAKELTAQAKSSQATEIASYITIPRKELITYSENYIGEKIKVTGQVFNILSTVIQMYVDGNWDSALYVNLNNKPSGIYENDWITVYGIVTSEKCFTNIYNAEICQPALDKAWYTKP